MHNASTEEERRNMRKFEDLLALSISLMLELYNFDFDK